MRHFFALLLIGIFAAQFYVSAEDRVKDFHDQDLTKKDFKGASLNGANFTDAILKSADFSKASLKNAVFKGADLSNASMAEADLTGADLRGSVGQGYWSEINLSNANLEGLTLKLDFRAKYRGANLKKAKLSGSTATNDFSKADLRGANLRGVTIAGTGDLFTGAIYDEDTAFPPGFDPQAAGMVTGKTDENPGEKKAVPAGRDFHDQDLKGKNFQSAALNGANFTDAILTSANFTLASLKNAVFKGAEMTNTTLAQADLTGADFRGSVGQGYCSEADFSKANMEALTMSPGYSAKYRGTILKKAKITGNAANNDFSGADFRGANLRGLTIDTRSRFKGALYDDDSSFPDGFDPKNAGMVLKATDDDKKPEK